MSSSLHFRFRGAEQRVAFGEMFGVPAAAGFTDTPATEVAEIITAVRGGRPWREEIAARFAASRPWLHDIILSPKRSAFLPSVLAGLGGRVLDIGCGWGQLTLPIASAGNHVVALEPVAERLGFVRTAAEQEGCVEHIAFVGADYLECEFGAEFSAILAIGVLEWAGAFQDREDPQARQRRFLAKTRSELAPGGALIIGIENRLGLKYLLGCPDDHIGVSGVASVSAPLARRRWQEQTGQPLRSFTYSDAELTALLREAGFTSIELFAALPDYKLPDHVVSLVDDGREFNRRICSDLFVREHNGYNGDTLPDNFQEELRDRYRDFSAQGIAHHFAPSFFVRAR